MIYKDYKNTGLKTSLLGMGCMRLPEKDGKIDEEKAAEIIDYAYNHGINYYDSAYLYHHGNSEGFTAKVLSKYPRDTWYLATKMPDLDFKTKEDPIRVFNEQLERAQVDYFDFYLIHGVGDATIDAFTNPETEIIPFLQKMKAEGKIRQLGFSSHCSPEGLARFVGCGDWDFAQIQLNYFDWEYQRASEQYAILEKNHLPVVVMEPCRGSRLADLGENANAMLKAKNPDKSIASWAFRYLQGLDNVQVILSGMTTLDQIIDNVKTFEAYDKLSEEEMSVLNEAKAEFLKTFTVPCTGCRYCNGCPRELDIPEIMKAYSEFSVTGNFWSKTIIAANLLNRGEKYTPYECVNCGTCSRHCPQGIDVPAIMDKFSKEIGVLPKDLLNSMLKK